MTNIRRLQDVQIGTEELINTYRNYFANRYIDAAHNLINTNTLKSYVLQAEWMNSVKTKIEDLEQPKDTEIDQDLKNKNIEFQYNVDELLYLNEYNGNVQYYKNNFVLYNNRVYFCIQNSLGNLPTNTSYWLNVGLIGEKGQYGLGVTYKGFWNENTLYNKYDLVSYQNNLYIAINDNSGNVPSQYEKYLNNNLYLNDGLYLGYTESNQYWFLLTRVQPQPIYIFPLDYTQLPSYSIFLKELSHSIPSTPVSVSGSIISINNALSSPVVDLTVGIEPVQEGTGDPSPSNVRPISGWTGMTVQRTGKNLLNVNNAENINAYINNLGEIKPSTTWTTSGLIRIDGALPYIYSGLTNHPNTGVDNFILYDINKNYIGFNSSSINNYPKIFGENVSYIQVTWKNIDKNTVIFEQSSTATPYEPYQGTTYPISWSTEAGTVYGGSLDVTTGVLTVDRALLSLAVADMNNGPNYPGWKSSGIRNIIDARRANYQIPADKFICNINSGVRMYCNTNNTESTQYDILYFEKDRWFNLSQSEWITNYPDLQIQFAILLDTPITYQLTPTEVTTLLGVNNVWADTGDMQMTYKANINS